MTTDSSPTSRRVRAAVVAGTFYPDDRDRLTALLDQLLANPLFANTARGSSHSPPAKAVVAPHAGYIYSGPVAASAYHRVEPRKAEIARVVLMGPSHRVPLDGLAVPSVDAFATPLGDVVIDDAARRDIAQLPGVVIDDRPHADEHSLEVHLPFLQHVLGDEWTLVPIVVGRGPALDVANALAALWGGGETLVVISSDLSHYHDYASAAELDRATADAIVARDANAMTPERACGAYPLRGLLELSQRTGLDIELLDLRSSGDTAGDRTRVVGYGAFSVT